MTARLLSFLIWALAAASAVYWALQVWDRPLSLPPGTVAVGETVVQGSVARLFGMPTVVAAEDPAPPMADARFQLVGVIAPDAADKGQSLGVALITVDNAPPRAYAVGSEVAQGWTLHSVERRQAMLQSATGGRQAVLQLPAPPEASSRGAPAAPAPPPALRPGSVPAQAVPPQTPGAGAPMPQGPDPRVSPAQRPAGRPVG